MKANEFATLGQKVLGGYGWMSRLSRGTGVSYPTVRRWASGEKDPPPLAVAHLRLLEMLVDKGHPTPPDYR